MPEPETLAGFGQHTGRERLVKNPDQIRDAAAQDDRQIRDREVHAQQGRRPQDLTHRPRNKAKAIRYGRRERAWRGTGRERSCPRVSDGHPGAAPQRGHQLGDVERIARRVGGEPQELAVGRAAGEGGDQLRRRGQRT